MCIRDSITTLKVGACDAVISFNKSAVGKVYVLSALGLKYCENCEVWLQQLDGMRVRKADKKFSVAEKKKRKQTRQEKRKKEEKEKHKDNGAGLF